MLIVVVESIISRSWCGRNGCDLSGLLETDLAVAALVGLRLVHVVLMMQFIALAKDSCLAGKVANRTRPTETAGVSKVTPSKAAKATKATEATATSQAAQGSQHTTKSKEAAHIDRQLGQEEGLLQQQTDASKKQRH